MRSFSLPALGAAAALLLGCGARSGIPEPTPDVGDFTCMPVEAAKLSGRVRDFSPSHPDFEGFIGDDKAIVREDLGADRTPVYGPEPGFSTPSTSGEESFHQWFHDTPGVNLGMDFDLPLAGDIESFSFDDDTFFPIDEVLLGDEGNPHNFHFTIEMHGEFLYRGGEVFAISGDDDLWMFVNGKLVVNLGGVHGDEGGSADVDALAATLGLVEGGIYPLDVFFAERHTAESALHLHLVGPGLCVGR